MRIGLGGALALALAGCGGEKDECLPADRFEVFADEDGDGFGAGEPTRGCRVPAGFSTEGGDCDDADARKSPGAAEACNGRDDDCDDALDDGLDGRVFFVDADGDRHGDHDHAIAACAPPDGYVASDDDCDDSNVDVHPRVPEVCNGGVDDDCDGVADDEDEDTSADSMVTFYQDGDGDGYGRADRSVLACAALPGSTADDTDCNDARGEIHPGAPEICNDIDDDCDGQFDSQDPDIDDAALIDAFVDADADGAGAPGSAVRVCRFRVGVGVDNDVDCDDGDADVNPREPERACNAVDDDCDAATLDDPDLDGDGHFRCQGDCLDNDPAVFPGGVETPADGIDGDCNGSELCYEDADGDGRRGTVLVDAPSPDCTDPGYAPPSRPSECVDDDPAIRYSGDWAVDGDGDGYGDGVLALTDCVDPGAGFAPLERPDCDDGDADVNPEAPDPCGDGLDADCDGDDACRSCKMVRDADPAAPSGVASLTPEERSFDVWCDQETDGGGWTLVGSSSGLPFPDQAARYDAALATLAPTSSTDGVWDALRDRVGDRSDLRFVCATTAGDPPAVDLSFYDVDWYERITRYDDDLFTCFQVGYPGYFVTPARRDNLTGDTRTELDPYAAGQLTGESFCSAEEDFAVDFEDAGIGGDGSDGTDWGLDGGVPRCGVENAGETWFLFLREAD